MNHAKVIKRTLAIGAMCLLAGRVSAQVENITAGELALTPAFCQDVQTMNGWTKTTPSPRTPQWIALMGETFWAMHHYCWALIHLQRAERAGVSPRERTFLIKQSILDFYFVVHNSPPDFVMLPEIYYRTGESNVLLDNPVTAMGEFAKSRKLKPDYWPAYLGEAKVLAKVGRLDEARDLLQQGLKQVPGQPNLLAEVERLNAATAQKPRAAAK